MASEPTVFHLIPHTHWDREWYLPRAAFEVRLARLFDELLPLFDLHPDFRFTLDGQTILVEDHLAIRPDRRERIAELVLEGRLAVGPWLVLADELIPAPAALRRNLALGLAAASALGGAMRVLFSPDAFGHPGWLPGLALDAGIRWGVLWRGLAGDRKTGPDLYRWKGFDGRSILIHHLPPEGYEVAAHLPAGGRDLAAAWTDLRDRLLARSLTRHVAVPIGADHHLPHPELPGLVERLRALEPAHEVRFSGWEDYFTGAESEGARPPVVEGELRRSYGYTWTLQGVHGSRARLKRQAGEAERVLALADGLLDDGSGAADSSPRPVLEALWRTLVPVQFHDTLAGTTADEVARHAAARLDAVIAGGRELIRETILGRAGLWNAAPGGDAGLVLAGRGVPGVVTAPVDRFLGDVLVGPPGGRRARTGRPAARFRLLRPDGRELPYQLLGRGETLHRTDRPYGYPDLDRVERSWVAFDAGPDPLIEPLVVRVVAGSGTEPAPDDPVRIEARWMETAAVRVEVAPEGSLTLVDRASGERYPDLLRPASEADDGDLYTVSLDAARPPVAARILGAERIAGGPLVGGLAVHWRIEGRQGEISGRTAVTLAAGSGLVRCRIDLDNQARHHRLRLRLPVGVSGPALAGDGVGMVTREPERGANRDSPREWPVRTAPAHRRVTVGHGARRITVVAPGFFEYEWTTDGVLWLTLLRSVGDLSRSNLPARPGHAGWVTATPEAEEPGPHRIELALAVGPGEPVGPPDLVVVPRVVGPEPARRR